MRCRIEVLVEHLDVHGECNWEITFSKRMNLEYIPDVIQIEPMVEKSAFKIEKTWYLMEHDITIVILEGTTAPFWDNWKSTISDFHSHAWEAIDIKCNGNYELKQAMLDFIENETKPSGIRDLTYGGLIYHDDLKYLSDQDFSEIELFIKNKVELKRKKGIKYV